MNFKAAGITKRKRDFGQAPPDHICPISEQYFYESKKGRISLIHIIKDKSWDILFRGGWAENFVTMADAETRIKELLS